LNVSDIKAHSGFCQLGLFRFIRLNNMRTSTTRRWRDRTPNKLNAKSKL